MPLLAGPIHGTGAGRGLYTGGAISQMTPPAPLAGVSLENIILVFV